MIVNSIKDILSKSNKDVNIKPLDIRNKILVFVNCKLPNPVFDTQTKENLTSRLNGTSRDVKFNDSLLKRLSKADMFADIIELSRMKEEIEAHKEMNKAVTKRIRIDKLVDANKAGTDESEKCHIFLSEGDCLYENTLITIIRNSEKKIIKIKNVKLDDIVITHKSNLKLITNITKKIEKSVTINLKNGEQLICSENHRWFVYDTIKNEFIFIKTKELDLKNHKMVINKNVNFNELIKINDITNIIDDKFDKIIHIKNDEILSTNKHKFSIYDIEKNAFQMLECDKINKDKHFLVNYDEI
jgi:hypothetical protein